MHGEAFNFGPRGEQNRTVVELLSDLFNHSDIGDAEVAFTVTENIPFKESGLLKLNCDKALFYLKWEALLEYKDVVKYTAGWYSHYFSNSDNLLEFTVNQIKDYQNLASSKGYLWTL